MFPGVVAQDPRKYVHVRYMHIETKNGILKIKREYKSSRTQLHRIIDYHFSYVCATYVMSRRGWSPPPRESLEESGEGRKKEARRWSSHGTLWMNADRFTPEYSVQNFQKKKRRKKGRGAEFSRKKAFFYRVLNIYPVKWRREAAARPPGRLTTSTISPARSGCTSHRPWPTND